MATTDYDFTLTRNEIIQRAFSKVGVLPDGGTLTGDQQVKGVRELNAMVKSWQARRVFLWSEKTITIDLAASTAYYSFNADPPVHYVTKAYLRDSTNTDTDISVISFAEYLDIPDKTDSGAPECCAVDYQEAQKIYVWPVPANTTYDLILTAITRLKDWDSASGNADFWPRWLDALSYGLAAHLAHDYHLDLKERALLRAEAEAFFHQARATESDHAESRFVKGAFE